MSYHKEYVVDGGCPELTNKRAKTISVHIGGFENKPVYRRTVNCDNCQYYFACVFEYESCKLIKEIKARYGRNLGRNFYNNIQLVTRQKHLYKLLNFIEENVDNLQKIR